MVIFIILYGNGYGERGFYISNAMVMGIRIAGYGYIRGERGKG